MSETSERTVDIEAWAESQVEAAAKDLETAEKKPRRDRGTGQIFQRGKTWWIAYYHRGEKIRESSGSEERKDAEKLLKRRLKEVGADQLGARLFVGPSAERVYVGELLDALEEDLKLGGKLTPQVRSHLRPIRAAFADRRAMALTAEMVDAYIEARLASAKPSTINRGTQLLHQAFALAVERGRLAFMPKIRRLSEVGNARQGFFERADFDAVVAKLPEYLQDFARFGYIVGWRKGSIASLSFADLDDQAIRLRAENSKSRRGQALPLEGELAAIIERRKAARQYTRADGTVALSAYVFHGTASPWATSARRGRRRASWPAYRGACSMTSGARPSGTWFGPAFPKLWPWQSAATRLGACSIATTSLASGTSERP